MKQKTKTKVDQVQSRTSSLSNAMDKIDDLTKHRDQLIEHNLDLIKQVKLLHAQKGGFVKHNNAYRKLIGELNINIKSKDIQVKSLKRKCEGLELTLDESYKYSRTNIDARNKLSIELQLIKTTWWYKLFTWSW